MIFSCLGCFDFFPPSGQNFFLNNRTGLAGKSQELLCHLIHSLGERLYLELENMSLNLAR